MLCIPVRPSQPIVVGEDENTCRGVFMEFMSKVARFEELAKSGERLLVRFRQDLEYFRSPQILNGSDVMSHIVKYNGSGRMMLYLEAGCRLHCQNISNLNQLHSCEDGLKDHINKVKTLLEELECLVKDVYAITLTANISVLKVSDSHAIDNKLTSETCIIGEDKSADQLDSDVFLVTVMVIVRNMLELDYTMQENIVRALSLKTLPSELEGYCLMWDLRPYIDDDVMHLAWEMCSYDSGIHSSSHPPPPLQIKDREFSMCLQEIDLTGL